jgi:tetratricopeptide (TPR) repeat protein
MKKLLAISLSIVAMCFGAVAAWAQESAKENVPNDALLRDVNTSQYVSEGSRAYLAKNYKHAIVFYNKALEQEMKAPTLEQNVWRVVVDNLGYSYYSIGNNSKAKEVFEYGSAKDDKFPMFYYNLACLYAEMNDLDNALAKLTLAFKYKDNMISGERLPNPATDSSFAGYLGNERFRRVLAELTSR